MASMEKRIDKLEADQADMKMIMLRIAESLLTLQSDIRDGFNLMNDRFAHVDSHLAQLNDRMDKFEQTEADHHKETIGFLSKHNK